MATTDKKVHMYGPRSASSLQFVLSLQKKHVTDGYETLHYETANRNVGVHPNREHILAKHLGWEGCDLRRPSSWHIILPGSELRLTTQPSTWDEKDAICDVDQMKNACDGEEGRCESHLRLGET